MTSTRLRLPFTFSSDDSTTPSHETNQPLDEQEQEALITTLRSRDAANTAFYTRVLTIIPLLFTPLYIPLIASAPLMALSALASLSLTAWTTYLASKPSSSTRHLSEKARGKLPARYADMDGNLGRNEGVDRAVRLAKELGERYGLAANVLLCLVLGLWALRRESGDGEWIRVIAPLPVAAVGWLGSWWVAEKVDVTELERLRYRLKGV